MTKYFDKIRAHLHQLLSHINFFFEIDIDKYYSSGKIYELIDSNDVAGEVFWLDAGYVGTDREFKRKGVKAIICEKRFRSHLLTDDQKQNNRKRSKIRCRIEHVYGFIERSMGGLVSGDRYYPSKSKCCNDKPYIQYRSVSADIQIS